MNVSMVDHDHDECHTDNIYNWYQIYLALSHLDIEQGEKWRNNTADPTPPHQVFNYSRTSL